MITSLPGVGVALLLGVLATPLVAAIGASRPHRDLALAFYTALYGLTNIGFYHDIMVSHFCLLVATLGCLPQAGPGLLASKPVVREE